MIKIEKDDLEKAEEEKSKLNRFVSKTIVIKRLFEEKKTDYIKNIQNKPKNLNVRKLIITFLFIVSRVNMKNSLLR
jgi:hypothetical protein